MHIVCHDKQEHLSKKCDPKLFYDSAKARKADLQNSKKRSSDNGITKRRPKPIRGQIKKEIDFKAKQVLPTTRSGKRKICAMA